MLLLQSVVVILLFYRAKRRILSQSHAHSRAHTNTCACSVVFLMSSNCPHPHPRPNGLRMRVNSRSPNQIHSRSIRGNGGRAWSDGQILGKWARQSIMGGLHSTFNAPSETSGSLRPLASFGGQDAGPKGEQTGQPTRKGVSTHIYDLGKVWAEKVVGWGRIRVRKVEEGGRRRERACGSMRFLKGRGLKAGALMGQKEHAHPHTCARAPRSIDQQRTGNELSSSVQSEGSITL